MASKVDRLRNFTRELKELPLVIPFSVAEWEKRILAAEMTQDDLVQLERLAQAHYQRAQRAFETKHYDEAMEESTAAILVNPVDKTLLHEILQWGQTHWPAEPAIEDFLNTLRRRAAVKIKKSRKPRFWWFIPTFAAVVGLGLGLYFALTPGAATRLLLIPPTGVTRNLALEIDTQGVPLQIASSKAQLLSFPEAFVVQISAQIQFPQHRIHLWAAEWQVQDSQKQILFRKEIDLRVSRDGYLEPGQGMEIFEQLNAQDWHDQVFNIVLKTQHIEAQGAILASKQEVPVQELTQLPEGYRLKMSLLSSQWEERFAARANWLNLEIENTGLKPFHLLVFELQWKDTTGTILKTLSLRPVSPVRAPLTTSAHVGFRQETVFDSEVFSFSPEQYPHPVLRLKEWQ